MIRPLRQVLIVTALTITVCSACSSHSKSSSSATSSSTAASTANSACPSSPGVTPTQVKVGVLSDQTGALASTVAQFGPAVRARFEVANQSGGINGRKIDELNADGGSDPSKEFAAGKGLVESEGAFALLNASSISAPLWDYLAQNSNIPAFNNIAYAPQFASAKNLFSASGAWGPNGGGSTGPAIAKFLKGLSVTSLAMLGSNFQSVISLGNSISSSAKTLGINTAYRYYAVPLGGFDATSVALQLKQHHPDAVLLEMGNAPAVSIIKAMGQQGFTPKVSLVAAGYDPSVLTAGISGSYAQVSFVPYLGPISSLSAPSQAFRNAMAKSRAPDPSRLKRHRRMGSGGPIPARVAVGWAMPDADLSHLKDARGECL